MKKLLLNLVLTLGLLALGHVARADYLNFAVVGVYPANFYQKTVVVNVADFPSAYSWGWKSFYLNIDGYDYPLTNWNTRQVTPFMARAWFLVPNTWMGQHRLQLSVSYYGQSYWGYPAPLQSYYSYPMFFWF